MCSVAVVRVVRFVAVLSLLVAWALPAAAQPLTKSQWRCATAVGKGASLVGKAQAKLLRDCVKQGAKGDLGAVPAVEACVGADAKGALAKKRLTVLGKEPLQCGVLDLPPFGVPLLAAPWLPPASPLLFDPVQHEIFAEKTLAAVPEAVTLSLRDAFGSPLDAGILLASANRDGAACQAGVAKAVTGCARAQRKAALSCAKTSLGQGTASGAALATACLMTGGDPATGIADPTGKLAKACATAVDKVLSRSCAGQVAAALPGVCGAAGDPGACLVARAGCRVCQELNETLGTARDCDLFDDGLDNASCGGGVPVCGNGRLDAPSEQCDDGNLADGDCCSAACALESTPCPPPAVVIDSPAHGTFSQAAQETVSGHVTGVNWNDALLTLNGAAVAVAQDGTFSASLTPDTARIFTPAFAHLTRQRDGAVATDRVVVIAGAGRAAATAVGSGLALRLNDSAFDAIEPLLSSLVPAIDLSALLTPGTVLLNDVCYLPLGSSCLGSIDLAIGASPPPGIQGVSFNLDSQPNQVMATITLEDLVLPLTVTSVTGAPLDCAIELHAPATNFAGAYGLSPLASDPTSVDVEQLGDIAVTTPGLTSTTTCSGGLGSLINGLVGPLFSQLLGTLGAPLNQEDGNGNTPIAAVLEPVFAGIDLGGVLGAGLGLDVDAPYAAIVEDAAGISFAADLTATALTPVSGAPLLAAFLDVAETFPTFIANTPIGATPYGVASGVSTAAVNALLRAQTEQGLLRLSVPTIDLGAGAVPLTAGALATALPPFGTLAPASPLTLRLTPTLAPVLTGATPVGGLAELRLGQLLLEIVENPGVGETVHLRVALDARFDAGLNVGVGGLTFALDPPSGADLTTAVLANPLGVDPGTVAGLAPSIVGGLVPDLDAGLGTIPLPAVVGASLEVARTPYYTVFADLGALLP